MKFFLDCEFDEDGKTIDLISIGVIAEDGSAFYRQNIDFDPGHCNAFVQSRVLPLLDAKPDNVRDMPAFETCWRSHGMIGMELRSFVRECQWRATTGGRKESPIEFWGGYAAYDWICVCQLFGTMMDLPTDEGWPMFCHDLQQKIETDTPRKSDGYMVEDFILRWHEPMNGNEHHALDDARELKRQFDLLESFKKPAISKNDSFGVTFTIVEEIGYTGQFRQTIETHEVENPKMADYFLRRMYNRHSSDPDFVKVSYQSNSNHTAGNFSGECLKPD